VKIINNQACYFDPFRSCTINNNQQPPRGQKKMTVEARTATQLISLINKLELREDEQGQSSLLTNTFYSAVAFINKKLDISHVVSLARELEKNPRGLTSLTLFNCSINDMGISLLCRALHFNTHLQSLNLGQNRISNVGAANMATLLKTHSSIKHINLSFNFSIKNLGATLLLSALEENPNIVRLRLVGLPITKATMVKIDEQINKNRIASGLAPTTDHHSERRKVVQAFSFQCKSTKVKPVATVSQQTMQ
jgi:hypothetical protein